MEVNRKPGPSFAMDLASARCFFLCVSVSLREKDLYVFVRLRRKKYLRICSINLDPIALQPGPIVPHQQNEAFTFARPTQNDMKHLLTATLTLLLSFQAMAAPPIILYRTLADYASGKGTEIGEFQGYEWSKGGVLLLTPPVKGKKPVAHEVTGYWGYGIGENVYRLYEGMPHVLLQKGNGMYYENGLAHMDLALDVKDRSDVAYGKYCFLSKDLESPIVYIPGKEAKKAFEGHAELQPFLTCIEKLRWERMKVRQKW